MATIQKTRDYRLDFVKLLSCIAVVGLHTLRNDANWIVTVIYQLCAFAVPCFFMASGVMLLNKSQVTYRYVLGKILRILRVVVLWHILFYGIAVIEAIIDQGFTLKLLMDNGVLCAKNTIRSLLQKGPFWQFWYFGAMCLLYLLLPLLHKLLELSKGVKRGTIAWLVLAVISVGIQTASLILGWSVQEKIVQTFRVWTWLQYFVLGGLMPTLLTIIKKKLSMGVHVALLCVATAVAAAARILADQWILHVSKAEYFYDSALMLVWVVLLFSFIMRLEPTRIPQKTVKLLAPLTMGVFVVHVQIRAELLPLWTLEGLWGQMSFGGVILILSFVIVQILRVIPFGKYLTDI